MKKYELVVIGGGPAGEKAAVKAAYFGHSVAMVEKAHVFGGAEVTSTIPSKTLKETALYFSGKYEKGLYGVDRDLNHEASIAEFMFRKNYVGTAAAMEIRENLMRHGVSLYRGVGSFKDPHTIHIKGTQEEEIWADYIIIAAGAYPYHPPNIPFDYKRIHDSDSILFIDHIPSSICIVGAGVIGCEYTTIFSTIGSKVYLINDKEQILPFVDKEVSTELVKQISDSGVEVHFNSSIEKIEKLENSIRVCLLGGKCFEVDMFLYAAGRSGNVKDLDLEKLGLEFGKRDTISVDQTYRTSVPHIYAVGDVIGFPALASTSMDQGRAAVAHIFKTKDLENISSFVPYGIYTVPEVSMVGMTEEEAKKNKIDYCIGKARYSDMARGEIMGARTGFLKLIFNRDTTVILGVHIIGNIASELIHYGVALVEDRKTLNHIIGAVFNFPTLHELYKYAAYDGLSNLTGHKIKP